MGLSCSSAVAIPSTTIANRPRLLGLWVPQRFWDDGASHCRAGNADEPVRSKTRHQSLTNKLLAVWKSTQQGCWGSILGLSMAIHGGQGCTSGDPRTLRMIHRALTACSGTSIPPHHFTTSLPCATRKVFLALFPVSNNFPSIYGISYVFAYDAAGFLSSHVVSTLALSIITLNTLGRRRFRFI